MNCDILKSKLILCEWNAFYFIEIAFIGFTLDEIKQCIVFFGTPGSYQNLAKTYLPSFFDELKTKKRSFTNSYNMAYNINWAIYYRK